MLLKSSQHSTLSVHTIILSHPLISFSQRILQPHAAAANELYAAADIAEKELEKGLALQRKRAKEADAIKKARWLIHSDITLPYLTLPYLSQPHPDVSRYAAIQRSEEDAKLTIANNANAGATKTPSPSTSITTKTATTKTITNKPNKPKTTVAATATTTTTKATKGASTVAAQRPGHPHLFFLVILLLLQSR